MWGEKEGRKEVSCEAVGGGRWGVGGGRWGVGGEGRQDGGEM